MGAQHKRASCYRKSRLAGQKLKRLAAIACFMLDHILIVVHLTMVMLPA